MDKPSFWERVYDFFIDDRYKNFVPVVEEEKPAPEAAQEAPTRSMELLPGETDLSYLVKDWDWNDRTTWKLPPGAAAEMGYAPQDTTAESQQYMPFMERMKANNYQVTLEELTRSPFANTSAYKNHLTPFTDLDPLIYGEQVQ